MSSVSCCTICNSISLFPSRLIPHHPTSSHLSHHSYIFISLGFNRAREFGCLYLNYGMIAEDESGIAELAGNIVSLLQQQGFDAEWSGNPDDCINVWLQPFYAALKD